MRLDLHSPHLKELLRNAYLNGEVSALRQQNARLRGVRRARRQNFDDWYARHVAVLAAPVRSAPKKPYCFPTRLSHAEKYGPAMEIEDEAEARAYFEACVEHNMRLTHNARERAEDLERQNILYYAMYHAPETRQRVARLFLPSAQTGQGDTP